MQFKIESRNFMKCEESTKCKKKKSDTNGTNSKNRTILMANNSYYTAQT